MSIEQMKAQTFDLIRELEVTQLRAQQLQKAIQQSAGEIAKLEQGEEPVQVITKDGVEGK